MVKRHKKLIIVLIILIILAVCGVVFIPKLFSKNKGSLAQFQTQSTTALTKMDLTDSVSATGTIESASSTVISADVNNVIVKKVLVNIGDEVVKGQKLVTFDKTELEEALQEAKEDYNDASSQASQELSQAYRQLSEAQATYSSDKARLTKVVKEAKKALKKARKKASKASSKSTQTGSTVSAADTGQPSGNGTGNTGGTAGSSQNGSATNVTITDNMTVSEAKATLKQAKENLATTNKQNLQAISQAKQAVSQAQTNRDKSLRQAKRNVQNARKTLKSASIKATMDGTVTALGVEKGSAYNGGDAVEISDLTEFKVKTTVDEYNINKIEKGQRVVILTDATGDEEIEGTITYVALTTGSTSLSSGSSSSTGMDMSSSMGGSSSSSSDGYEVEITLNKTDVKIRAGMTAKCSIIISEAKDVFAVPYDAIHTNSNGDSVIYVSESGSKKEVVVEKGMESDYYVEISSSELTENMSVIIPSDATSNPGDSSDSDSDSGGGFGLLGGNGNMSPPGDFPSGGFPGGNMGGGPP